MAASICIVQYIVAKSGAPAAALNAALGETGEIVFAVATDGHPGICTTSGCEMTVVETADAKARDAEGGDADNGGNPSMDGVDGVDGGPVQGVAAGDDSEIDLAAVGRWRPNLGM